MIKQDKQIAVKQKDRKEKENKEHREAGKRKWRITGWIRLLLLFLIIITIAVIWKNRARINFHIAEKAEGFFIGGEGELTTVTESTLEKTVQNSELYTAEYPYNGYTAVYEEDGETVKYYVAYEGTVKAGIDVSKIDVTLEEEQGVILIRLPEITVDTANVEPGTMEYIFEDEKYHTETVAQEAYRAAAADLAKKAQNDTRLIEMAEMSAESSVTALTEPLADQLSRETGYKIQVLRSGEENEDE